MNIVYIKFLLLDNVHNILLLAIVKWFESITGHNKWRVQNRLSESKVSFLPLRIEYHFSPWIWWLADYYKHQNFYNPIIYHIIKTQLHQMMDKTNISFLSHYTNLYNELSLLNYISKIFQYFILATSRQKTSWPD